VVQAADHLEVLEAGQVLVDGGVLAREPDVPADLRRLAHDVEAGDPRGALVRPEERREDPDRGRLPGAVGPEEAEDHPSLDPEVDAPKRLDVAVALAQALRFDRDGRIGHALQPTCPASGLDG
jgi:hypothetical protein